MRKCFILTILFSCLHIAARGQTIASLDDLDLSGLPQPTAATALRYWYDNDVNTMQVMSQLSGYYELDASVLTDGLHTLYCQLIASDGTLANVRSDIFMKMENAETGNVTASKLLYWYDDETTIKTADMANGSQMLDASKLSDGLHTLHFYVMCSNSKMTTVSSALFFKLDAESTVAHATGLRYWFDNDDASAIVTEIGSGTQALDVSNLSAGLHTLCYQLIDDQGKANTPVVRMFFRDFDTVLAEGENRITKYQYWLNNNSQTIQTVTLDNAENPYTLLDLLPMPTEPIHSDCFQFEMIDGVPTLYARNVFNICFYDVLGYFRHDFRTYVDYSVKQEVTDLEWLQSGIRATTAKPAENTIKWYCLEAEPGDSLQFRIDRAATIQLFSPSGDELYTVSGVEAVKWGGVHVWESGMYYLALHDVTATYGNNINIEYNHIDKYAVLRQDVTVVGNGGCSTITFEGNGFRDLYAVDLFTEQGDSIHHVYIGHESDATTSVVFDFTDATLGQYSAKFRFAEEDKVFNNLVTVEEARDIKLATTVSYPSMFLRGSGKTTYYAIISNEGNMTSYRTPVYVFVKSLQKDGISRIKISGLDLPALYDGIETDNLDVEDKSLISATNERFGDTHYFVKSVIYDETLRDSVFIWAAYFFTDIAPESVKNISAEIATQNNVNVWFTIPKANNPLSGKNFTEIAGARGQRYKITREEYCCMRSKIECFASIVADGVGIANSIASLTPGCPHQLALGVADCVVGAINQVVSATGKVMCDNPSYEENFWDRVQGCLNGISVVNTLTGCASKILPAGKFKDLIKSINDLSGNNFLTAFSVGVDIGNCINAFTEQIPNCPPNSGGGGGSSNPVNSLDPNDIYGYTAESGSHAVKNGLTDVYYRIEFENDPVFATAPAHEIVVTNQLDATKFDLASFVPTRIKIGNKTAELTGEKNFVTTIDMRPGINAIAQVEGTYDTATGTARWHIISLDPMTMEPTQYVTDGVLPVNDDGNGIGEVWYDIKLKADLQHGTEVSNQATIVFDTNEAITTPVWTNTIDRIAPESHVTDVQMLNDSTATVSISATDELSGPWRYDVYVQYGTGAAWWKAAENVPADTTASVRVYEGIDHGFYVVVTDSAGNVEQKIPEREFTFEVFGPKESTNTRLQLAQGWNWISHNQQEALSPDALKPKARRILSQTDELNKDEYFGWTGGLRELLPTEMYKVQMTEADEVQLSGRLFNATFRSIPLYTGWNWLGYPAANTMTPDEALQKMEAEEGDFIVGQNGITTFSGGRWAGTLTEMVPGHGYMYRSVNDKNFILNTVAQSSSRRANLQSSMFNLQSSILEGWTVDKHKYPNVMGLVADLVQDGETMDASEWLVGAFCGEECRGQSQAVGGHLMMNVYGSGGERISFKALNRESGEVMAVEEIEPFRTDILGAMQQPYALHSGVVTGISFTPAPSPKGEGSIYMLDGRRVEKSSMASDGIYIVTDGNKTQKHVNHKR